MFTFDVFFRNKPCGPRLWARGAVGWALLFWMYSLWGQTSPYLIRFSTAEGLPSNNTGCLANDPEGFVWVGTRSGLARFDGQRFAPFRSLRPKTGLPEENVTALLADRQGWLWVQFPKQLYRVSLATFDVAQLPENLTPQCMDEAGRVYFSCSAGVAVFQEKEGVFQLFPLIINEKEVASRLICKGKDGVLLVGTSDGVFRFDTQRQTYSRLSALDGVAAGVLKMETDAEGMLWLSNWFGPERGIIRCDPYADRVLRVFRAKKDGISTTDLNDICPDGDNVWMATNSGGLCRYAVRENRFYCYEAQPEVPGHLWHNQVARLLKDRFGNLWASSPFFLYQCPARRTSTILWPHDPQRPNSLIASQCTNITPISDDLMAFGTLGGISIFDRKKRSFLNVRLPAYGDYNNQITGLAKAKSGGFWASSWTGLYRLDTMSGRILEYFITNTNSKTAHPETVKHLQVGAIRRMCTDRTGMLWMVNFGNHIFRLDEKGPARAFAPVDTLVADTIPLNDRAEAFLDLDERYFLLGTLDGVVRYDRSAQRYELCPVVFPGLTPPVRIESLARSHNGDVLCIANGKPFRLTWASAGATATQLPMPNEVFQAQHIVEDRLGNVWVSTENGVVQINEAATFCLFYDSRNYLNNNVLLLRPSVIPAQDPDGHLYFGGARGVSILNPQDFKVRQSQAPPVKIISLRINDQLAEQDSAIHRLTVLRLPYDQNNLTFAFAALHSAVPERNRFAYRLNDGEWVDLGNQNTVNFSRLAPGDYILQVKAANSDGVWNEQGARLSITIWPPWWRSWWAYLAYFALLALALRRYLLFREKRLQLAHQLEAERKEAERLQELDNFKSRFFANISHEFRTPLTVILGMADQLAQSRTSDGVTLSHPVTMIKRSGQNLLRLINQILDLAKMEDGKLMLQPERADMVAFSRYIVESLHSLSEAKGVPLHFESEADEIWMDFDLEKMQSVLFNLLSNALKFTPEGGDIYLKIAAAEQAGQPVCRLTVRDTGIGIPPEKIGRIFDRFYRVESLTPNPSPNGEGSLLGGGGTGIGLAFTRELVRLMGGEISVESEVGKGASFEVVLPVRITPPLGPSSADGRKGRHGSPHDITVQAVSPLPPIGGGGAGGGGDARKATIASSDSSFIVHHSSLPTLLIVEDNDDVREYLRACVSGQYYVLEAKNGREGIEMALEHTPDLIVSDVMMPEKDGFELCQTLKNDARTSHIPIVLLTAKASVESRIAGLSRGADAYLSKPFHREELLLTLTNLLQSRRVLQERLRAALLAAQAAPSVQAETSAIAPETLAALEVEDVFVQKIRRYVEENMGNTDLSMDELSRAMTMSYQNLHRKLTALTSLSPVQFIRTIRLQKAMSLLQTTRLPIGDVAFEVGFSDPKYFSRVFTEEFGKPPSAVRESSTA